MPRKQKKYHYIYRTTCQITGKFYVGMHSTDDLEDGYLGSGKILGYSIAKHGRENHKKEILEYCKDRNALKKREAEIVNEGLLSNSLNINLKYGGEGGFDHLNTAPGIDKRRHTFKKWYGAGKAAQKKLLETDSEFKKKMLARLITASEKGRQTQKIKYPNGVWAGKKHTEETKKLMSLPDRAGIKNSQYGTCWVIKNDKPIKIKKTELDAYLADGFIRGRKLKNAGMV